MNYLIIMVDHKIQLWYNVTNFKKEKLNEKVV